MFKIVFEKRAEKEFLKLDKDAQDIISKKILELKDGILIITIIRIAHRKEVY